MRRDDALWLYDGQRTQGHALGPVAAAVWGAADGTRDVAALVEVARAVDATADARLVWQVLDGLADAGLLEARLAPAAPVVDRRALLGSLGAAALVAAFGVRPARAQEAPADRVEAGGDGAPAPDAKKADPKNEAQKESDAKALRQRQSEQQAKARGGDARAQERRRKAATAPGERAPQAEQSEKAPGEAAAQAKKRQQEKRAKQKAAPDRQKEHLQKREAAD